MADQFENKVQAEVVFKSVIDKKEEITKSDDSLNIKSSCTFQVTERAARKVRNLSTGQGIESTTSKTVKFTHASTLKSELNGLI